jgi:hypothetical protein
MIPRGARQFLVLNQIPRALSWVILASHNCIQSQIRFNRALQRQPLKGRTMANNNDDDVPFMQKLLDNHFLLLFLGVASPGLLYILWGVIDIMSVPLAK